MSSGIVATKVISADSQPLLDTGKRDTYAAKARFMPPTSGAPAAVSAAKKGSDVKPAKIDDVLSGKKSDLIRSVVAGLMAQQDDELLHSENLVDVEVTHSFTWLHDPEAAEQGSAALANAGIELDLNAPRTPLPSKHTADELEAITGNKIDFRDSEQYLVSAVVTEVQSEAPFPIAFDVEGLDDSSSKKELFNGNAAHLIILPRTAATPNKTIWKAKDLNLDKIKSHGNMQVLKEASKAVAMPGTDYVALPSNSQLAGLLQKNNALLEEHGPMEVNSKLGMLLAPEKAVTQFLEQYQTNVTNTLQKVSFTKLEAKLSRPDRSANNMQIPFGDARDAPNITTSAYKNAHTKKQTVYVKVRYSMIDPALIQ